MAHNKNRKFRFFISCVLSFLLSLFFTVGTILIALKFGFLNETSVLDGMAEKDYYKSAEKEFYQAAKVFTIPVGLPVDVVDGIVSSETVYSDIQNYVTNAVNGKEYVFNTDDLESRLTEKVYNYFRNEGLEMTEEQITTVPEYTGLIAEIYVKTMKVNYVSLLGKVNASYGNLIWIGAAICLVISIVIIGMLLKMYHWKHRAMRFVVYSAITTVLMVASPAVIVGILEGFMKPSVSPEHLYYALVNYCANGLKIFVYLSIGWVAVVAALLLAIRYLKKND